MCMVDDGDVDLYNARTVAARKPWRCGECGREIEQGERYEYVFAIWEGDPGIARTCLHCVAAREWLMVVCNGFMHGAVFADMADHIVEEWLLWKRYSRWQVRRLVRDAGRCWRDPDGYLLPIPDGTPRPSRWPEEAAA